MVNCPFHNDSNASFSISTDPNKPVYHCFGCGKKGSWVGYYMERQGLSYSEAMAGLGQDAFSNNYVSRPNKPKKENIKTWWII